MGVSLDQILFVSDQIACTRPKEVKTISAGPTEISQVAGPEQIPHDERLTVPGR